MRIILLALVVAGCRDTSPPTAAPGPTAPTPASVAPASAPALGTPDPRTSADLAAAWVAILQEPDEDLRLKQADALATAWQARRYTWTGLALASLCFSNKNQCALQVFTADLPERARLGGVLPLVTFGADAWPKITAGCAQQEQCVVRFEATLKEARTDPEQALRLIFVDGKVLEARLPATGEPWFRPAAVPRPGAVPPTAPASAEAPPALLLNKKVF